ADDDAGCQGKVEDSVLAAINNIAREAAQRQVEEACKQQRRANNNDDATENQQKLSQVSHWSLLGTAATAPLMPLVPRPLSEAWPRAHPLFQWKAAGKADLRPWP